MHTFKLVNSLVLAIAVFVFKLLGLVGVGVGVGAGSTTLGASTTVVGDGVGVGFAATFLTIGFLATGFLTTGFLATGFLTTTLAAGFLGAEKEVVGKSNVNERAKTTYFFMMPFSNSLLYYLALNPVGHFGFAPDILRVNFPFTQFMTLIFLAATAGALALLSTLLWVLLEFSPGLIA